MWIRICTHTDFLAHLHAELLWYRAQLLHERARAERAIDTLLQVRAGVAPVTPPGPRAPSAVEQEIAAMLGDQEFTGAGQL